METYYATLDAPEGVEAKYATFALLGEPGYAQKHMEIHYVGSVGAGKTTAMMDSLGISLLDYHGARMFIARDYAAYLEESTLATFKRRFQKLFDDGTFRHLKSDGLIVCEDTGSSVTLLGLDAPKAMDRLLGSEWFRGYIDQAESVREEVVNESYLRLRQIAYHRNGQRGWNFIKATSNWHRGKNWIWKRCVPNSVKIAPDIYERRVEGLVGGKQQVAYRLYIESRYGENLSVNEQYGSALLLAGHQAKKFISDGPAPGAGLVWPEWDDNLHSLAAVESVEGLPIYVGLDSGLGAVEGRKRLNHPTVAVFGSLDEWGAVEIVREYVYPRPDDETPSFRSAKQNAQAIARIMAELEHRGATEFRVYGDLSMWEMDTSGRTVADDYIETWLNLGFPVTLQPANRHRRGSVERGNDSVRHLLTDRTPAGTPRFRVSRRDAPYTFEMMGTITTQHVEKDTWGLVDIYDAVRYLGMNVPEYGWYGRRKKQEQYEPQMIYWGDGFGNETKRRNL